MDLAFLIEDQASDMNNIIDNYIAFGSYIFIEKEMKTNFEFLDTLFVIVKFMGENHYLD